MVSPAAPVPSARPPVVVIVVTIIVGLYGVGALSVLGWLAPRLHLGHEYRPQQILLAPIFVWLTWRRSGWAWGILVGGGAGVSLFYGLLFGTVAVREGSVAYLPTLVALSLVPAALSLSYLSRPARAWHGFACPACGAFRWRMATPATQVPCRRCGSEYGQNP